MQNTLMIDRKDTHISINNQCLTVRVAEQKPVQVPLKYLASLVTLTQISMDSQVISELSRASIEWLHLAGDPAAHAAVQGLTPNRNHRRRWNQINWLTCKSQRLSGARFLLSHKLRQQNIQLHKLASRYPNRRKSIVSALRATEKAQVDTTQAHSMPRLRGIEGAAGRAWFQCLGQLFPPGQEFNKRTRRPPKDPANALISLTHTMAHQQCARQLNALGLDAAFGMLHDPAYSRLSLACDLQELVRAELEVWVLELCSRHVLGPEHFGKPSSNNGNVYLNKKGRNRFYAAWYEFLPTLRQRLQTRARFWMTQWEVHHGAA